MCTQTEQEHHDPWSEKRDDPFPYPHADPAAMDVTVFTSTAKDGLSGSLNTVPILPCPITYLYPSLFRRASSQTHIKSGVVPTKSIV
jgi:hypothetical protein